VQHGPTQVGEGGVLRTVAGDVPVELRLPPVAVVTGHGAVLRATVPETAVDEDGDPGSGERHIGAAGQTGMVDPEPQSPAVQLATQGELGLRRGAGHPPKSRRRHGVERRWQGRLSVHISNLSGTLERPSRPVVGQTAL